MHFRWHRAVGIADINNSLFTAVLENLVLEICFLIIDVRVRGKIDKRTRSSSQGNPMDVSARPPYSLFCSPHSPTLVVLFPVLIMLSS